MNSMARSIVDQDDGLVYRHGELWGARSEITRELRRSIRDAVERFNSDESLPVATMAIERPSGKPPLLVMVSVVGKESHAVNTDLFRQPVAVVYFSDPARRQETSEALLQRLFALTSAEARLLKSLVEGSSVKEASNSAGITEGTARGYLKQIFAKTKTKGQADLIRRVSNSPAWLRHQAAEPIPPLIENSSRMQDRR